MIISLYVVTIKYIEQKHIPAQHVSPPIRSQHIATTTYYSTVSCIISIRAYRKSPQNGDDKPWKMCIAYVYYWHFFQNDHSAGSPFNNIVYPSKDDIINHESSIVYEWIIYPFLNLNGASQTL